MRTVTIETSLGPIPVTGAFGDKLSVLAIPGAFADEHQLSRHPETVAPEFDGYVAHLPGWITPPLAEASIPAFTRAFDEVLAVLGPSVVVGYSAGALVALGLRSPLLKAVVAVEPPLLPAKMWSAVATFRSFLGTPHDGFVRNLFGVHEDRLEERDYRGLLDGLSVPLHTIVGSEPLYPVRPLARVPSVVDEPERALLQRHGHLTVAQGAGHAIPSQAGRAMLGVVLETCRLAVGVEPHRASVNLARAHGDA